MVAFALNSCQLFVDDDDDGSSEAQTSTTEAPIAEATLAFSTDAKSLNIVPMNESITLSAEVSANTVSYQWYESSDGTTANASAIQGATGTSFEVPAATSRGIRYYYCTATTAETKINSSVATVVCTGLPVVQIDTVDSEEPTADQVSPPAGCYGAGLKNATKVPARMRLHNAGTIVYDSGEYVKKESGLTIKLRGNTSAYGAKKPYKLKLQKKADLLSTLNNRSDSKYQDKDWILLKDGTSLNTFVGMSVADIAGTSWTPEFAYVNVVINGDYRGIYMLIEAISRGEKRADVSKNGYIIERDAYWWNEDVKFITNLNQKYTFKYPDEEDITDAQLEYIKNYMNTLEENVQTGTYEDYLDTESFARWQLIHDILGTLDSGGSNIYMTKYDNTESSKIIMSTPWDFDSNYRMTNAWSNVHNTNRIYSKLMFESETKTFINSYKSQWQTLSSSLWTELYTKLIELQNEFGDDINLSRQVDAVRWSISSYSTVQDNISTAQSWFTSRISWLDSAINAL